MAESTPIAAALLVMVAMFLRQQRTSAEHWADVVARGTAVSEKVQREVARAISAHTKVLTKLAALIERQVELMDRDRDANKG
jgi:hypothetical protein